LPVRGVEQRPLPRRRTRGGKQQLSVASRRSIWLAWTAGIGAKATFNRLVLIVS